MAKPQAGRLSKPAPSRDVYHFVDEQGQDHIVDLWSDVPQQHRGQAHMVKEGEPLAHTGVPGRALPPAPVSPPAPAPRATPVASHTEGPSASSSPATSPAAAPASRLDFRPELPSVLLGMVAAVFLGFLWRLGRDSVLGYLLRLLVVGAVVSVMLFAYFDFMDAQVKAAQGVSSREKCPPNAPDMGALKKQSEQHQRDVQQMLRQLDEP